MRRVQAPAGNRQPTLVADGCKDIVEPPANSRIIAARIPDARLRFFADAGHAFMFQYNRVFARIASAFLSAPLARLAGKRCVELDARADAELRVRVPEVRLDGLRGDEQRLRDLTVRVAGGGELDDPPLARRQ